MRPAFRRVLATTLGLPFAAAAVALAFTLVSVEDEVAVGRAALAAVRRDVAGVTDPVVNRYVERIGARLAARARGPRYPYVFFVANRRELNAFALPGGPIVLNRGAIENVHTEAQLAAILAHEVAHISERHAAAQLTNLTLARWSLGLLGALLGNAGGALTAQVVATAAIHGTVLSFSRDDERAADAEGAALLARAGWDPRAMVDVMALLERKARRQPSVPSFFATHPAPADRLARLRAIVALLGHGRQDSAAFRDVRARARRAPAPAHGSTAMPRP